jgi:hypothetical protein
LHGIAPHRCESGCVGPVNVGLLLLVLKELGCCVCVSVVVVLSVAVTGELVREEDKAKAKTVAAAKLKEVGCISVSKLQLYLMYLGNYRP